MKIMKRLIAAVLAAFMTLTFTACHKKGEIAVSAKDFDFTSAYYMCALINADSEAKSKVQENLTEEEASAESINYYSKEIDGKKYETWVKDQALANLKEIAAYKILCKENKVELDDEMVSNAEMYASYYWSSYGYSAYYEPNGVGQETYTQYMKDTYYAEAYFNYVYGEEGTKAISAADVKKEIYNSFIIADILEATYTSEMTDEEKTELKEKLDGYVSALKNGKKTFEEVYNEYNNIEETEEEDESESDSAPKDSLAQVLGDEDSAYAFDYYDEVKKMKTDAVKLITLDDDSGYMLVVKKDIKADKYYLDSLDSSARHQIADEDFEAEIKKYTETFELEVNKYAINQFKVKKIKEPDYSDMY